MKSQNLTKALIGIFLIVFIVSSAFASSPAKDKYQRVQAYVNNHINYPDNNAEKVNGIVLVEYSVTSDGSLNIAGINASNQLIRDYVENQFNKIEIKDTSFAEDTSFVCKYIFVDEDNLDNIDNFKLEKDLQPNVNYLAEN